VSEAETQQVIEVGQDGHGVRLDHFLERQFPQVSRVFLRRAVANNKILVNGHKANATRRLHAGDLVQINVALTSTPALVPEPIPVRILFEDEHLLVVDKPAGMLVYPNPEVTSGTLMNALCFLMQQGGTGLRPGLVHRLDRDTSGLMVVAKTTQAHRVLAKHFRLHWVTKKYLALVHGRVVQDSLEVSLPVGRVPDKNPYWQVTLEGREALTCVRVLERVQDYTLLEAEPKTGRTHQIRVHLAAIGHPVVGDSMYGCERQSETPALNRHFLHAASLEFNHPRSGERLRLFSPLPPDLADFLDAVRNMGEPHQ
jgi:23S rRNA pseudouridine1911/1915/1917 synthase